MLNLAKFTALDFRQLQKLKSTYVDALPLMINAYGKGDAKSFLITGSETPQSIPYWIFILLIGFLAWGVYYLVTMLHMPANP